MCGAAGLEVFMMPLTLPPWWAVGHAGLGTTQTWSSFGLTSPMFVGRW